MGPVESAVMADLEKWGADVAGTSLAALALDGARRLDSSGMTPTPASMLQAQLRATLLELAKLAPIEEVEDEIAAAKKKRDERRGA